MKSTRLKPSTPPRLIEAVREAFSAILVCWREVDPQQGALHVHQTISRWVLRTVAFGLMTPSVPLPFEGKRLLESLQTLVSVDGLAPLEYESRDELPLLAVLRGLLTTTHLTMNARTHGCQPTAWLGRCYEELLSHRVLRSPGRIGAPYWTTVPSNMARKGRGSFFTPMELTEPTVRRTIALTTIPDGSSIRVLDPAMGAGALLIAALRVLVERTGCDAAELVSSSIYGVDRDPIAVELAKLALWVEVGDRALDVDRLCPGLRLGDALFGTTFDEGATYPREALLRQSPDKHQEVMHHPKKAWHQALMTMRREVDDTSVRYADDDPAALDRWCALWVWPLDALNVFPTPDMLQTSSVELTARVEKLTSKWRFFHWHHAFPEVFSGERPGFDVVLANPPWETVQPELRTFFADLDPGFLNLNHRAARAQQRALCQRDPLLEASWLTYLSDTAALSNFLKRTPRGPLAFHHQGPGKPHLHKLFTERCHGLCREGGALGLIIPAAFTTDHGASGLRRLLFEQNDVQWLYGFENRDQLFDIHRSFKFAVLIARKGGSTSEINWACLRHDFEDWGEDSPQVTRLSLDTVRAIAPNSLAFVETESTEDLALLEVFSKTCVRLGGDEWGVDYAQGDFNMTGAARHFIGPETLTAEGFKRDATGLFHHADGRLARPIIQGVMVGLLEPNRAAYISGTGVRAVWDKSIDHGAEIKAQYAVMQSAVLRHASQSLRSRFVFRSIARNTDTRTFIGAVIGPYPTGHSLSRLSLPQSPERTYILSMLLTSLVFDWQVRARIVGTNMSKAFVSKLHVPDPRLFDSDLGEELDRIGRRLQGGEGTSVARSHAERHTLRVRAELLVAKAYGLDFRALSWMLRGCDLPAEQLSDKAVTRGLDPKGFWRVDRALPAAERLPVMVLNAAKASQLFDT